MANALPLLFLGGLCAAQMVRWLPAYAELLEYWRGYILNYYVIGYQDGFVSRGLVGTVVRFFCDPVRSKGLYLALVGLYVVLYGAALVALSRMMAVCGRARGEVAAWGTLVLLSPAVTNFIYDFGRPDIYLTLIAAASLALCGRKYGIWLIVPLGAAGILIHEGYLILLAPLVYTELMLRWTPKKLRCTLLLALCAIVWLGCFGVVYRFGKTAVPDAALYWQQLQRHIDIPTSREMVLFEFAHTLPQLLRANFQELMQWKTVAKLLFLTVLQLPTDWLYLRLAVQQKPQNVHTVVWLVYCAAPLSPLLMIFVGVDYGRWISLACICIYLRMAQLIWTAKTSPARAAGLSEPIFTGLCGGCACLGLIMGPMGDILEHCTYLVKLCRIVVTPFGI